MHEISLLWNHIHSGLAHRSTKHTHGNSKNRAWWSWSYKNCSNEQDNLSKKMSAIKNADKF